MNDTSINAFNLKIRQTPWYQEWFQQRGLNPNHVKLNDRQRDDLKRVVEANTGFRLPGDMKIDPAGNLNEKGGWAGLPTGVKIAIIGGAALATGGALGVLGGAGGAAGGGAGSVGTIAGGGAGAASAGTIGGVAAGSGAVAGGATAAGIGLSDVLMASLAPGIAAGSNYFANRAASRGAREAADAQIDSANYAADLDFRSAQEQLDFFREQEARRREEFDRVQAQNRAIYEEERDYTRGQRKPFHDLAVGSIGHLTRPMRNISQAGSIGARVRR